MPYFFSVPTLLKTLFSPWKNLTARPTNKARPLSTRLNDWSFNLISRGMGCIMRLTLIFFYMFVQAIYILLLPIIIVVFFITWPITSSLSRLGQSEEEKKASLKKQFITQHILRHENMIPGEAWFESWYQENINKNQWWELKSLFALPPLARDWAAGYTPTLDEYTEELTASNYQGTRTHLVGRQKEIDQIERVLSKSAEANIVLCGDEGVGKHTIIDALARKVYEGQVNVLLMYKRVLKLNLEKILTQDTDPKRREELLNELFDEALQAQNVILIIEEIDRYVTSGEGRIDLSSSIEKYAKAANLHFIGVTTPYSYEQYMAQNPIIQRLFTKVDVYEISKEEAYTILLDAAIFFEKRRHGLIIPYETVVEAIEKSEHFITNIPFPEKTLQLLDEACVVVGEQKKTQVLPEHIDQVLHEKTHIPMTLSTDFKVKLLKLETSLRQDIVQQEDAIDQVASGLRRAFLLMGKRKKPLASFLFLGPTGVGKTETAKAIARTLFDSDDTLVRFDMSLFQTKEDIAKLIGSQVTKTPGLLTASLREHPYGVLLLDELEKADKNLINIFLTILDEGYYTDGYGKRVDCKNLVIIATSNAGVHLMYEMQKKPGGQTPSQDQIVDFLISKQVYSPEFLNRFDGIIVYSSLDQSSSLTIARSMLNQVLDQVYSMYKVKVQVSDQTLKQIVDQNYNPTFGARNLERALRTYLEDTIAKQILSNQAKEGDTITL